MQFGVMESCREMATRSSVARIKRLALHLAEYPRLERDHGREEKVGEGATHMLAGIDWAGCPRTSRSTNWGESFFVGGWGGDRAVVVHPGDGGIVQ